MSKEKVPDLLDIWEDLMVHAAFRYCLGRATYIVPVCVDWLLRLWIHLHKNTQQQIRQEVQAALDNKKAGWDMDEECWIKLLQNTEEQDHGK